MTLLEQIQSSLLHLPPDRQSEVLDFIIFLQGRLQHRPTSTSVQQKTLMASLQHLAELGIFREVDDPSAWQKQIRKDRPLPGRTL